jgi:hypothetical protein
MGVGVVMAKEQGRVLLFDRYLAMLPREEAVLLRDTPVILADNVFDYCWETWGEREVDAVEVLPNVAPPFPRFWCEYGYPSAFPSGPPPYARKNGCLIRALQVRTLNEEAKDLGGSMRIPDEAEWVLTFSFVVEWSDGDVEKPEVSLLYAVAKDGSITALGRQAESGQAIMCYYSAPSALPDAQYDSQGSNAIRASFAPLMALCFMHCKNVAQVRQPPPEKLSKAWTRRHGRPLTRYTVLNINPMKKVLRDEGGAEHTGLVKALHICRGHFKHFTEEHPLFGKAVGTYWWPMHARGRAEAGVVVKDYRVHPVEGGTAKKPDKPDKPNGDKGL